MKDITINPSKFELIDGDFLSQDSFYNHILEEDGSFRDDCQLMIFKCDDLKVDIYYEIKVSGSILEDAGDYWTPPSSDINIDNVDISISTVLIDEDEVELTDDLKKVFLDIINKNL